ncbi:uncharacterized protein G2W53_000065 [Senna tora]|uniref:Uncharacterized protein n=1 Tax=Senna tora TaxID=362788 RepID=A0A834XD72_9FABA|nr:uncharacterized protein G2W53_000065 [Senna tora]
MVDVGQYNRCKEQVLFTSTTGNVNVYGHGTKMQGNKPYDKLRKKESFS